MKFFPFNLSGPEFLFFYAMFGVGLLAVAKIAYWLRERAPAADLPSLTDPYAIAFLRGGPYEAVRVAILSLVDRNMLAQEGDRAVTVAGVFAFAQRPIEQAILGYFEAGRALDIATIAKSRDVPIVLEGIRRELHGAGLLHDPWSISDNGRLPIAVLVLAALVIIALVRIAWSGPPYLFLVLFTAVLVVLGFGSYARRATSRGKQKLVQLEVLFKRLRDRAASLRAGGQTNEVALLAAVFGLEALPLHLQPTASAIKPKGDSSSGGCGSSSDASSDSGSGGGCGGGCGGD